MEDMKDMEDLERLREKEFAERVERIQNTMSRFKKIAYILMVIAAAFMFFHMRKDYNNYAGSQLVMAEVVDIEGASDENISVTYRYNIAGKEYESNKVQHLKKIKNGDKEEIRVKKDSPEVILKYNDVIFVIFCDVMLGFCLGLTVVFYLYEMANCMLPSEVEEAGTEDIVFTTTPGATFSSIMEENKKKNKKINSEKKI